LKVLLILCFVDLISEGLIQEILDSYTVDEFSVDEIATSVPEFRHFLYKNERLSQFIEPRHLSPFDTAKSKKKLFRRYQHVHSKVHEPKLRHLVNEFNYVILSLHLF
jgi:hypothetical protein